MGNETAQPRKNRNSYSMDFSHEFPDKILPKKQFKLAPLNGEDKKQQTYRRTNRMSSMGTRMRSQMQRPTDQESRQASQKLNKLNMINDQLRKELIKISSQLTIKLKKKKYAPKVVIQEEENQKKRNALKRQLQNAYKQIDMYKKNIEELKTTDTSERADQKLIGVENKIGQVDIQIEKTSQEIQSLRNVMNNQSAGMKKDRAWETIDELKNEAEAIRISLRQFNKQSRKKQKKYMQQHQYMMLLDHKIRQLNGEYVPEGKHHDNGKGNKQQTNFKEKISEKDVQDAEQEVQLLKIKHDEYHKKINSLIIIGKQMKQVKSQLRQQLQEKKKQIEGLKYKRDAFVKQIKDNLHLFATRQEHDDDEQFSEFQSQEEVGDQITPIHEETDERGTFDIEHLKDHTLKSKSKEQRQIKPKQTGRIIPQQPKQEPKQWKKRVTRVIEKGKPKDDEKPFGTGLKKQPKTDMRMVMMNIWMTKKKQITAIQPVYMIDGQVIDGEKSSNNVEDQYRVTYQLQQFDFIKSILGIIGKQGFIEYLVLQSHFGKVSRVGRGQTIGDNFAIGVAKEETPIQITGASAMDGNFYRLNRLQFEVLIEPN